MKTWVWVWGFGFCVGAFAGVKVESIAYLSEGAQGRTVPLVSYFDKEACRVEVPDPSQEGATRVVIYQSKSDTMIVQDPTRKTYFELTKAQINQVKELQKQMMSAMSQQMKNLTPEQRKQMEAMMGDAMKDSPKKKTPKIDYQKVGTGKVGKWSCDRYVGKIEGKPHTEFCAVPMKSIGVSSDDFKVMQQLSQAFTSLSGGDAAGANWENYLHLGFPVEIKNIGKDGRILARTEVKSVNKTSLDPTLFQTAKGYKKQDALQALTQGMSGAAHHK